MTPDKVNIDRIVREVLRRLDTAPAGDGELVISAPVVGTAELDGRLAGVRRLKVGPKAVVTPAARDLLAQAKVAVSVETQHDSADAAATTLMVGVALPGFELGALLRSLAALPVRVEQIARTGLADVVTELADEVGKGGRLGLLMTDDAAAALCLANRHRGVRAVAAADVRSIEEAIRSVGANLLVLNPKQASPFQLQKIVEVFCRDLPRACPDRFKQLLGE